MAWNQIKVSTAQDVARFDCQDNNKVTLDVPFFFSKGTLDVH